MDGHDNDANKNAQNNSAGRQGIFSTPELTVNAENIAQQNNEETKSRVASIFANTDAGKQAQKLNDAMDAQTVPAAEDLVIQNGPKKKSKLPIILLILVLVAAGVGGLAWVLMNNIKPQETVSSIEEAKRKFDNYATYILYGEKADVLAGTYDRNEAYELSLQFEKTTPDVAFWNTASTLLSDAASSYVSAQDKQDTSLELYLSSYKNDFDFVKEFYLLGELSMDQLIKSYASSGIDMAKEYVKNYYSQVGSTKSTLGSVIINSKVEQYTNYVDVIGFYADNGCLVDNVLDDDCVAAMGENVDLYKSMFNVDAADQQAYEGLRSLIRNLEKNCWTIDGRFSNPIIDEEILDE